MSVARYAGSKDKAQVLPMDDVEIEPARQFGNMVRYHRRLRQADTLPGKYLRRSDFETTAAIYLSPMNCHRWMVHWKDHRGSVHGVGSLRTLHRMYQLDLKFALRIFTI